MARREGRVSRYLFSLSSDKTSSALCRRGAVSAEIILIILTTFS